MPSSFTGRLRFEKQATGENLGSWGTRLNDGAIELVDDAIAGALIMAMPNVDYTLGVVNGGTDEARRPIILLTGTAMTAQRDVILPAVTAVKFVINAANQPVRVRNTGAGTGVVIPSGHSEIVISDSVNCVRATGLTTTLSAALAGKADVAGVALLGSANTFSAAQAVTASATDALVLTQTTASTAVRIRLINPSSGVGYISYSIFGGIDFLGDNGGGLATSLATLSRFGLVVQSAVQPPAGSSTAPSWSFSGDTNTGCYNPAADVLAWSTGGIERARLDATALNVAATDIRRSGASIVDLPLNIQAGAYQFADADRAGHVRRAAAGAATWTIPANATTALPVGTTITLSVAGTSGTVTLQPAAGVTLTMAGTGSTGARSLAAHAYASLTKLAADEWLISGVNVT